MKEFVESKEKLIEILFLGGLFVFMLMWAYIQPLNASPDEIMRYQIPQYIAEYGRLPHGGDPIIRNPMWGISYGFTPILSYIISAFFMKVTGLFTMNAHALLMSARLVSVLFGVGTAYFAIRIGKKVFPKKYGYVYILLVALLPQALFITTYVNCDSLAVFASAFIVYMWIYGAETRWNYKSCIGLAVGLALCTLSYYNAYGFILCSALFFTCSMLLYQREKPCYAQYFKKGFLIAGILFVLVGWWFIRNAVIYHGDILGMATSSAYAEEFAATELKPSNRMTYYQQGISIFTMLFRGGWLEMVYVSFIGCFGPMNIFLPNWSYGIYTVFFAVGAIGVLINFKEIFAPRKNKSWNQQGFFHIFMAIAAIIPNILNAYYSYTSDYQPQGRYSLPMLIPFMYFIVLGIQKLTERYVKSERAKKVIVYVIAFFIIVIILNSYFRVFAPNYK
jgi:4-amino-4-deoxy-L-arabinose transferase-like glycosyltransferase